MGTWFSILTVLFILSSVILVLVILVQRPQGGGLAQAFGGASGGATDTAFGGRTGDVLTYLTMGAFAFYLLVAIGLNVVDNSAVAPGNETEEQMIEPGLLPTDPAAPVSGTAPMTVTPVGTSTPAPSPVGVPASDQPLVAPAPAPTPATTPAPVTTPPTPAAQTPASGKP